jgi:hypothetical protein
MAHLGKTFSTDELPESTSYDPLPEGWYTATIGGAELRSTKAGDGQYIAVKYVITGPTHQGRIVFGNLNISNPNPQAEEIGRKQLGELMRAIGLNKVSDTDQLIGGHCSIKLSIRKQEGYEPSNDVKGFKAVEGSVPPVAAAAKPAASGAGAPPWAKK